MSERGVCVNCKREMALVSGGHCITCFTARKGLKPGTEEYIKALASVRDRITSGGIRRAAAKKKTKPVKALRTKSSGAATDAAIIDHLKEQLEEHLAAARKLGQAIELLS